ncbi:MAG: SMC-Scp complex subunit ScpB, partial [Firmicutes bacterium]|nr:SMC-Scp complex subunit ScpB [Bacillota bacterium]
VRGIKSDRVLETLMKKDLVEEKGRSSSIGRPILYGTTRNFLFTFGFESLDDLPELEDVGSLVLDDDLEGLELPRGLADPDQLTLPIEEQ